MAELQSRIVPLIVDYSVFWTRYFYRLHLLREKHSQRQQLAQRAQQARSLLNKGCSNFCLTHRVGPPSSVCRTWVCAADVV